MDKEYIEREAVLVEEQEICYWNGLEYRYDDFVPSRVIRSIPAADVEPVRHGEWVERNDKGILNMHCPYMCSICGRVEELKEPYCNCGAKMDGGKE